MKLTTGQSWPEWVASLRQDPLPFSRQLAEAPFEAFLWECRPDRTLPFACHLLDCPPLARVRPDASPFGVKLRSPINTFPNLRGDSTLIAPGTQGVYPHLAAFLRTASDAELRGLWGAVADAVDAWTGPLYLSTHGLGVYWLHVRLDSRPKYFRHGPFRAMAGH